MSDVKERWEYYGENDPYFAVLTFDKFRAGGVDSNREEFFASGETYIDRVWQEIEDHFAPGFSPKRAVDFGCGVGRLIIPLAARCAHVTGVDISGNMLAEARRNCDGRSIENVELVQTDDFLASDQGPFDLVHSVIVFQHIPPSDGMRIVAKLIDSLTEGGIGALHFTYAATSAEFGSAAYRLYLNFPFLYKLRNLVLRKPNEPLIPMHNYNLNAVFQLLQDKGCHQTQARFTHHGLRGALVFFQKVNDALF